MNEKNYEMPSLFSDSTTEDALTDEFSITGGLLSYGGYWVAYRLDCRTNKASAAVYSYDGHGGLDKMLEVGGGIDTGSAIKVAMNTIDYVKEF
ncbi:MAG: hypothetical protein LUE89_09500 [Clostridiales bacterium]|nr:hypothetical protein [Clostridiales bacterium]